MVDIYSGAPVPPQGEQIQIYFNGAFDAVAIGAPMYFWIIFGLTMIIICGGILVAYYRFFILDKIWDFVTCYKNGSPLALIRTRYRKAYFKSLKYIAQMFVDEEGPDKWFAPSLETSQSISGVNLVDCVDYYDWLQDPILNQTIYEIAQAWNEKHDDNEKIYDPIKFQELLKDGKLTDFFDKVEVRIYHKGQVAVPAFFPVDISKVEQYLPRTRSSAMFGGYTQWLAESIGNKEKVDWKSWVLPIAALCTIMIVVSCVCYLIITSAK
jgi:hypothetical protein